MEPAHLREDLRQEVILIICELPDEKLIGLYERGELEFYTVRVMLNHLKNSSNSFSKKFRNICHPLPEKDIKDDIDFEERKIREMIEEMAIQEIDKQYWYNKGLIALYCKHGNFRAIEKETGIPWPSVYKTIRNTFNEIKNKFNEGA